MNIKSLIRVLSLSAIFFWASISLALAQQDPNAEKALKNMQKRIGELEAQVLNMQVIIGSLESLLKQQRANATVGQFNTQTSGDGSSSGDGGSERMGILETKVQALTAQIEQLTNQLQNGSVSPGNQNRSQDSYNQRGSLNQSGTSQSASLPSVNSGGGNEGNPAMMYDEAYGHLLRRDYSAAEQAFQKFLKVHTNDNLAGNARYWLGEAYYQQGNFKKAADSFLKGYSKHRQGPKAPDSLLKLALSLNELGQTKAACSTFSELRKNFPEAPNHVSKRAEKEIRRIGC